MHRIARALAASLLVVCCSCYNLIHPLPAGVSFRGPERPASELRFLADLTWVDGAGQRHVEQNIFDAVMEIIKSSEQYVIVDMFLYNDFQGDPPETTRALSSELTAALIARKQKSPQMAMIVISDPVNTVYGGIHSVHFDALEAAGIPVVLTRLDRLRDSNPSYSTFWRVLAKPLGNTTSGFLPSPFSDEKVSTLSYLSLLNFKANHRKVIIADQSGTPVALVTSANPHDGSSAHGNVAIEFRGAAVADLLASEEAVIALSDGEVPKLQLPPSPAADSEVMLQVLTEGKIREALLAALKRASDGDRVSVAVFYLSDHGVVDALGKARARGAEVRVLLDPNKDAFGHEKSGVPNRPVAAMLRDQDVAVRWCDTHGEQCHAKLLLLEQPDESFLLLGSANFTRRNLQDFNLETSIAIRGAPSVTALRDARAYFELVWNNEPGRRFSADYEAYEDESLLKHFRYEVEERSGLSTF